MPTVLLMHGDDAGDPYLANTSILLNGDGADNGTVFTNYGVGPAITRTGVVTKTGVKKFGTASIYSEETSTWNLQCADHTPDFSGDFTVEGWFYWTDLTYYQGIIYGTNANRGLRKTDTGALNWMHPMAENGFASIVTADIGFVINTWYHIAVVRASGVIKFYVDGVLKGSFTYTGNPDMSGSGGVRLLNSGSDQHHRGYADDIRITEGVARYTAAFTPPAEAFPTVSSLFIDQMGHTVTKSGDASVSITGPKFGIGSYLFAGTGYLTSTHADYVMGTGDFTGELFFYATTAGVDKSLMWLGAQAYLFFNGSDNTVRFQFDKTDASSTFVSTGTVTLSQWNHVAFGRSGTKMFIALNGTYTSQTDPLFATNFTGNEVRIGSTNGTKANMIGNIDDIRLYKGADVYNQSFTPPAVQLENINAGVATSVGSSNLSWSAYSLLAAVMTAAATSLADIKSNVVFGVTYILDRGKAVVSFLTSQTRFTDFNIGGSSDAVFKSDGITQAKMSASGSTSVIFESPGGACRLRMATTGDRVIPRTMRSKGKAVATFVSNGTPVPVTFETKIRCAKFLSRHRNKARFGGSYG